MPVLSVIIPTCRSTKNLESLLTYFGALESELASLIEVVVVDDDANRSAVGLVKEKFHFAQVAYGEGHGIAAAANIGASVSSGDFLVFLDDDAIPTADWTRSMTTLPASLVLGQAPIVLAKNASVGIGDTFPGMAESEDVFVGNMVVRREFWGALGPFNEKLGNVAHLGVEHVDWLRRAHKQGVECVKLPFATVEFLPRRRGGVAVRKQRRELLYCLGLYQGVSPRISQTIRASWYQARSRISMQKSFACKMMVLGEFAVDIFLISVLFDRMVVQAGRNL